MVTALFPFIFPSSLFSSLIGAKRLGKSSHLISISKPIVSLCQTLQMSTETNLHGETAVSSIVFLSFKLVFSLMIGCTDSRNNTRQRNMGNLKVAQKNV